VVVMAQGRARECAHDASTRRSSTPLTRRRRKSPSHLEVSHDIDSSSDNVRTSAVSEWRERRGAQLAETRVSQCSLVVLDDTEARYLGPLLTVQPSTRFRFRSFT
jgi:hypothetical protein